MLTACAPRLQSPGPQRSGTVQLVYSDWQTDWFAGMAQRMLEQFHAANPNIQVFFTPDPDDLAESMMLYFQQETAPDVLNGCCDFLPIWAQKGYLLDLRPFVEADLDRSTIDDWSKAQYEAFFRPDGLQFALPKYHGALALYYNKDMFDRSGVAYPDDSWTHDDYLAAMQLLVKGRNRFGDSLYWASMFDVSWERIQVHVNGWGGHFVDPSDPARSMMGNQEALDAMQWLQDRIWVDHTMASELDVQNLETRHAFIQERIAMVEDGSWALKDILESAPFRVGVAPFPAGPKRRATLATTDGFAIYAGTQHPEAAWELLKFLVSRDYGRAMAQTHLLQPARASLVEEWVDLVRQEYPEKARDIDIAAFAQGHLQGYSVIAEVFPNMADARRLAQAAWEKIYTLGQAPVSLMTEVSAQIEAAQQVAA
jgi:multiple sugar transport system substrate-binding protein